MLLPLNSVKLRCSTGPLHLGQSTMIEGEDGAVTGYLAKHGICRAASNSLFGTKVIQFHVYNSVQRALVAQPDGLVFHK